MVSEKVWACVRSRRAASTTAIQRSMSVELSSPPGAATSMTRRYSRVTSDSPRLRGRGDARGGAGAAAPPPAPPLPPGPYAPAPAAEVLMGPLHAAATTTASSSSAHARRATCPVTTCGICTCPSQPAPPHARTIEVCSTRSRRSDAVSRCRVYRRSTTEATSPDGSGDDRRAACTAVSNATAAALGPGPAPAPAPSGAMPKAPIKGVSDGDHGSSIDQWAYTAWAMPTPASKRSSYMSSDRDDDSGGAGEAPWRCWDAEIVFANRNSNDRQA